MIEMPSYYEKTIVFCDIRGYSKMCKQGYTRDPVQMNRLLGDWYLHIGDTIDKYRGQIDKLIGDGIIIMFDDTKDAFYCSCAILMDAKKINDHLNQPTESEPNGWLGMPFAVGIGIEAGEVAIGTVTIQNRQHVQVVGEVVNSAARLAEIAAPGEILIGEGAYDKLKSHVVSDILERTQRVREKKPELWTCWKVKTGDFL